MAESVRWRMVGRDDATQIVGGVAVVVDVMRAYTVAAWAFHLGAIRIFLVDEVEQAVNLASKMPGALLFKDGSIDARFDLHNSPQQLMSLDVEAKTIVQRTGAGTRAAVAAAGADVLLCTSFVCATGTARFIERLAVDEVTFVISGGLDADEDLACAQFIAATVNGGGADPAPFIERASRSRSAVQLRLAPKLGQAGVGVDDVPMCLAVDRFDFAMLATSGDDSLVLTRVEPTFVR
jgi:2-phosphosulfolactate phosphatase